MHHDKRMMNLTILVIGLTLSTACIAFAAARLFKTTGAAVGASAAIVFVMLYFLSFYLGHSVSGLSIWHLVGIAGLSAAMAWAFRAKRARRH
mgnify:CR=1 FL=1